MRNGGMRRVLIANRGEIAVRIARAVRAAGLEAVAVYSDADAGAMHVAEADLAVHIGPSEAARSYLDIAGLIAAAEASGADAVHPGYGFLSENPDFAQAVIDSGRTWIGPTPHTIELLGDKARAKVLAREAGVPVLPGWEGAEPTMKDARGVGFPLLIKAVAGGGGRGLRVVADEDGFEEALAAARREATAAFGRGDVLLERYVVRARHVEVQILGDGVRAVPVGERECSVQRRHQKVIEEAPSVAVDSALREELCGAAVAAAQAARYTGAGTVEFLLEPDGSFWFLEVNARLQVEHPVTEAVWGVDLVAWQLRLAAGEPLPERFEGPTGWAMEARLYAEDPAAGFLPQTGRILAWTPPPGVRVDTGVRSGDDVSSFYDPMIAKIIAEGPTREEARSRLLAALRAAPVLGPTTNAPFLIDLLEHDDFARGAIDTGWLERQPPWTPSPTPPAAHAVAALLLSLPDPMVVPWHSRGPSNWPVHVVPPVRVHHEGGRRYRVEGAETTALEVLAPDRIRVDGVTRRVQSVRDGRSLHVAVFDLGACALREPDPLRRDEPDRVGDGTLRAPMSGRVVRADAVVGATVARGDRLLVLEAMKMETPLLADRDGAVAEVRVAEGDQVRQGDVLVIVQG
jgi:acetyl/propionyl-CoA carboxylase alpha subunit